jgi:hypothetical protein
VTKRKHVVLDFTEEATRLGYLPFTAFDPFSRMAFDGYIGEWAWPLLEKKLKEPGKASPLWTVQFCSAILKLGLDVCSSQDDLYEFVTKSEAFKAAAKARRSWQFWTWRHFDKLKAKLLDLPPEIRERALKKCSDFEHGFRGRHKIPKPKKPPPPPKEKPAKAAPKPAPKPAAKPAPKPVPPPPKPRQGASRAPVVVVRRSTAPAPVIVRKTRLTEDKR